MPGVLLIHAGDPDTFPYSYTVRIPGGRRDALVEHLRGRGIGTAVHYPPNHLQPAFAEFRVPLPVTELVAGEVLCLPFYAGLTPEETQEVIEAVRDFFNG
jgi:dTDP-4-amino-4,6-dideoxygalactose transaminase